MHVYILELEICTFLKILKIHKILEDFIKLLFLVFYNTVNIINEDKNNK